MSNTNTTAAAKRGPLDVALMCLNDAQGRSRWARNRIRRRLAQGGLGVSEQALLQRALQRLEEAEEELEIVSGWVAQIEGL